MNRFRFEHMWLQHSNFENILKDSWNQSMTDSFGEQVSLCGTSLSKWANKEFGSVRKRKKELTEKLEELQKNEENEESADEMKQVELELDQVLKLEETMWFQRSRALWLKDGDRNSAFFHEKASHRKRRNTIKKLVDENSTEITKREEIVKMVRDYFMTIFSSEGVGENIAVLEALECKVTPDMNETLTKPYTEEEIRIAIKQMHPAKAPGPDGMTPLFYQKFWHVINSDVLHAVLGILNNAKDPSSLNHTRIVLIPKVKNSLSPKQFRPISLCNVVFRIITKTIANRVKKILPDIISDTQSAFIPGRIITDNAMSAFEIFHTMKNKKIGKMGYMAMKLDMSKAYDRVEWHFLESVMAKLGFCDRWIALIMRCVRTVSYAVLINGVPSTPFLPERGLRQGDPLSPYLFLLCAEAFTALLRKAESEGRIHGIKVTREAPTVSHLFFADDTILFTRANTEEANEVKRVINLYEQASGQRINLEKTEITVSSNIEATRRKDLSERLGAKEVDQHSKYLGLPTLIGRSKKQVFTEILERVLNK